MSSSRVPSGELKRSDELRAVTARLWSAWTRGDVEAVLARFSPLRDVSGFGTDPSEWFHDPAQIERYTRAEFDAVGGAWPFGPAEIEAWAESDVGWSTVQSQLAAGPDGSQSLRCTCVFHLERDEWKVVHQHWSVGVPNERALGVSLPLEALAEVVGDEHPDLSSTAAPDGTVTIVFHRHRGLDYRLPNASFGRIARFLIALQGLRTRSTVTAGATGGRRRHGREGLRVTVFMPAPLSARRALACSRAIEREIDAAFDDPGSPIKVRIGVHVGEVIHETEDFFGHAVNYAARVAGAAQGGEVLVSSLVHDLVASTGEFGFEASREVELKGIEGAQRVYSLELV